MRPFIRTIDDDNQKLYFPKEYINASGTAVSQDNLASLIDMFYHEVDVLLEHFSQDGSSAFSMDGLRKSVKDLCENLAKVETTDIIKAMEKLDKRVAEFSTSSSPPPGSAVHSSSSEQDTVDAINVALRCSLVEDLQEVAYALVDAVKQLVKVWHVTSFLVIRMLS